MSEPGREDRELLLAELHLCQQAMDALSGRCWQSTGILLAGTMATLALMLQVQAEELAAATITSLFGAGAIVVLATWMGFVRRELALQKKMSRRMLEVEEALGLKRQGLLKERDEDPDKGPFWSIPLSDQSRVLYITGTFVAAGWVLVAGWRWLIYAGAID